MPDPRLVSRAQRAATMLERAWERWRATQGLAAEPMPPVSSYVGYSIEEPWGRPRVVFGVDAEDAERLAALLQESAGIGAEAMPRPEPGYRAPGRGGFGADRPAVPDRGYDPRGYEPRGYEPRGYEQSLFDEVRGRIPVQGWPPEFSESREQLNSAGPVQPDEPELPLDLGPAAGGPLRTAEEPGWAGELKPPGELGLSDEFRPADDFAVPGGFGPPPPGAPHVEAPHVDAPHVDAPHVEAPYADAPYGVPYAGDQPYTGEPYAPDGPYGPAGAYGYAPDDRRVLEDGYSSTGPYPAVDAFRDTQGAGAGDEGPADGLAGAMRQGDRRAEDERADDAGAADGHAADGPARDTRAEDTRGGAAQAEDLRDGDRPAEDGRAGADARAEDAAAGDVRDEAVQDDAARDDAVQDDAARDGDARDGGARAGDGRPVDMRDGGLRDGDARDEAGRSGNGPAGDTRPGEAPAGDVPPDGARTGGDAPARSGGLPGKHQLGGDQSPAEDTRDAQHAEMPRRGDTPVPGPRHGSPSAQAGSLASAPGDPSQSGPGQEPPAAAASADELPGGPPGAAGAAGRPGGSGQPEQYHRHHGRGTRRMGRR